MSAPRILSFAGSTRRESVNRKLLNCAVDAARAAGGDLTVVDLADYPLPLMDEDLEAGQGEPANAAALKQLFLAHQGLLLACPEYNSSITPLLKNVIDWVSRRHGSEAPLAAYQGKVAGLISASPSVNGGMRGLVHVRSILGNIGVLVLPDQVTVAKAHEAFAPDGSLKDSGLRDRLGKFAGTLVRTTAALHG
ncbi:MAG: NAD(P)H-dependent oxidoreductase [Planctomyces sp.]|nr:NAD(P)H-dependent oxidoreductase [Planctomyces sp.]